MSRFAVASLSLLFSLASLATEQATPSPKAAPTGAPMLVAVEDVDVNADADADVEGQADAPATAKTPEVEKTPAMIQAEKLVAEKLVGPLAMNEEKRSRFSRARMPAQQRRVRVLDAEAKTDKAGDAFLAFAVDARHGFMFDDADNDDGWRADAIVGCVYPKTGKVFVKMGEGYRPGDAMLGKKVKAKKDANATVCEATTQVATR